MSVPRRFHSPRARPPPANPGAQSWRKAQNPLRLVSALTARVAAGPKSRADRRLPRRGPPPPGAPRDPRVRHSRWSLRAAPARAPRRRRLLPILPRRLMAGPAQAPPRAHRTRKAEPLVQPPVRLIHPSLPGPSRQSKPRRWSCHVRAAKAESSERACAPAEHREVPTCAGAPGAAPARPSAIPRSQARPASPGRAEPSQDFRRSASDGRDRRLGKRMPAAANAGLACRIAAELRVRGGRTKTTPAPHGAPRRAR
jgi:hypothetical protein